MDTPTTYADLTAAGWAPAPGPTGYRFRSVEIGDYEITAYTDGGGVSLERRDGEITIPEADTVALATKIAALLRGEPGADLVKAEARITEAHAALDEAGAPACDGVLSGRITALAASLDATKKARDEALAALNRAGANSDRLADTFGQTLAERNAARAALTEANTVNGRLAAALSEAQAERNAARAALTAALAENGSLRARRNALHDALARMGNALSAAGHHAGFGLDEVEQALSAALAERDTLRARLAERPAPPDHRDPPVETAAEATIRRLRYRLTLHTGFDYTSDRHADTDLVEVMVRCFRVAEQSKADLQTQLERAERIAKEQLDHRLRGT